MEAQTKKCTKCGEVKPLGEFYNHKSKKDGKTSCCKTCRNKSNKAYLDKDPKKKKDYISNWRKQNRDRCNANRRYHYYKDDKIKENNRIWKKQNRESIKQAAGLYRKQNPEKEKNRLKNWRNKNKQKVRARDNKKTELLADSYIKILLNKKHGLAFNLMTPELVENERKILKAKRFIKQLENGTDNKEQPGDI